MTAKYIVYFLSLFLLLSCSDDETVTEITNPETSLIELDFTNPPIDLQGAQALYASDIAYDQYDKTKFDVFLPTTTIKTGLVIFIHGGGFTGGDKDFIYTDNYASEVVRLLNKNIAVATINYRLLEDGDTEGVLKSLNDSKRAIQYMRYFSNELNINKEDVVLFGSSAGASTALWLATNDDLKDVNNADVVLQESSRVKGIALNATQSSLDIEGRWIGNVFAEFGTTLEDMNQEFGEQRFYNFYGVNTELAYNTPEVEAYRKQVDMLSLISSDDPEIWVSNTGGHNNVPTTTSSFNHHPFHAREIKRFADANGVANVTTYGNPVLFSNANNEDFISFLIRKIEE